MTVPERPPRAGTALEPVRGTRDLLPEECARHRLVEDTALAVARRYGFAEIATPIFEFTEVFARTLGATTDIVTKEMYSFVDRGGESITLRPEGTAGVARAIISNGLAHQLPLKLFYRGPMFRYERPQKGRQRQFHQIGVELVGMGEPFADVEIIALAAHVLDALGILDKVTLELNTLGDEATRLAYRDRLVDYLRGHVDRLSADSRLRLERNPLRILDSKDAGDRAVIAEAPLIVDHLNDASRAFLDRLTDGLAAAGVAFQLNPRLVRGLDYYCHTAFEFTTTALGAQGTVLAGGRYDGLIAQMGGSPTPGTGWAAGVERLAMLVGDAPPPPRPIAIVALGDAAERWSLATAQALRRVGFVIDVAHGGGVGKRMKRANKINARVAIIVGDDELARAAATVRDMDSGTQDTVPFAGLADHLATFR